MIIAFVMIYILFTVYCITQGMAHAILYCRLGADSLKYNEHKIFVVERSVIIAIIAFSTLIKTEDSLILAAVAVLGFSFWHNGSYYITKGKILKQHLTWFEDSKTSTAVIEINYITRIIGFIISLIIMVIWLLVRNEIIKSV